MTLIEFLGKADAALASAKRDLAAGDLDGAANRLYYAMFHAARAALLSVGEPAEGRHGTIIAQFSLRFCRDGPLPTSSGEQSTRPKNSGSKATMARERLMRPR